MFKKIGLTLALTFMSPLLSIAATPNPVNVNTDISASESFTADYIVGAAGGITLTIKPGITLTTQKVIIGDVNQANNNVLVDGVGARWYSPGSLDSSINNTFILGYDTGSTGNKITISNGGLLDVLGLTSNHDALIGYNAGANNNQMIVTGSGSIFKNETTFYLGRSGSNNLLTVQNGGSVESFNVRIGGGTGSNGVANSNGAIVDGAGSLWTVGGTLRVGGGSATTSNLNYLNITQGGVVNVTGNTFLGYDANSDSNSITINGLGSQLNAHAIQLGKVCTVDLVDSTCSKGHSLTVSDYGYLNATSISLDTTSLSNINLNRGAILIAPSISSNTTAASNNGFNIHLGSGASYAYVTTGKWLAYDLDSRPMVTGANGTSPTSAGVGNIVTASQSLYQRTADITQSLDDRLRAYDQEEKPEQAFWIKTYYSDSSRGGQDLSASRLAFNDYRSGVTLGFDISSESSPIELILNYERNTLNIDQGNQGMKSHSVMGGFLFPRLAEVLGGTVGAKAMMGYSDFEGDRKVYANDVSTGFKNVTASYQATTLNLGTAWVKTLYQSDDSLIDTLVGVDLNTQYINDYSESSLFKWNSRTLNQIQSRAELGLHIQPMDNPLTLYGRVGLEHRDVISGENQSYSINGSGVSFSSGKQNDTYATVNTGAYYPFTKSAKAFAQVKYTDSSENIHSVSGRLGFMGEF